jgi:hypothetical protein
VARKAGKDRGITQRKGREGWWVRLYVDGRERWYRCDTKSQAKALYGRLRADIREGDIFPREIRPSKGHYASSLDQSLSRRVCQPQQAR